MVNYPWAVNQTKLLQAEAEVIRLSKVPNSTVEVNEANIKAEYIKRAGKIDEASDEPEAEVPAKAKKSKKDSD